MTLLSFLEKKIVVNGNLHSSHSRFLHQQVITSFLSFTCFLLSNHCLKHIMWMFPIDPAQLQGVIKGFYFSFKSSSLRQIRQTAVSTLAGVLFVLCFYSLFARLFLNLFSCIFFSVFLKIGPFVSSNDSRWLLFCIRLLYMLLVC